jgi:hypothetical protein
MSEALRSPRAAPRRTASPTAWLGRVAGLLALAALLHGCGGGGSSADESGVPALPSTPSTSASGFTEGTIGGFGSIVVNGVRFDDGSAQVLDDNGGARAAAALKLGMQVQIEHDAVDAATASARAHVIRFGELLRGPVSAVDPAGGALTVLGQRVLIGSTTVFDSSLAGGLSAITVGTVVEVHGVFDAARNAVLASRIEAAPSATSFTLRGTVTALDTAAKTFVIGGATISYASIAAGDVPSNLANNRIVRVTLNTAQVNGLWVATAIKGGPTRPADRPHADVRGIVTSFTSTTLFAVNGLPVDATTARFPDGTAGVVLGAQVDVEGSLVNGVLIATQVELEERHRGDDSRRFSLHGDITALDATARTLVVRGTTVRWDAATVFQNGGATDLAVGQRIRVKGGLAPDRLGVQAETIRFER